MLLVLCRKNACLAEPLQVNALGFDTPVLVASRCSFPTCVSRNCLCGVVHKLAARCEIFCSADRQIDSLLFCHFRIAVVALSLNWARNERETRQRG